MIDTCIFCGVLEISISMQVKTDNGNQTISICAEHEDDASPKKIRELVNGRDQELKKIKEVAKRYGYNLVAINKPQSPMQAALPTPQASQVRRIKPTNIVGQEAAPYDTAAEAAPGIYNIEGQEASAIGGRPISIPKKIVSEAGTTEIHVVNTGGDAALQNRFKALAAESKRDGAHNFSQGYAVRDCLVCGATGITKINNKPCQKCDGTGTV